MSIQLPSKQWLLTLIPISLAFTAIAWAGIETGYNNRTPYARDTVPTNYGAGWQNDHNGMDKKALEKELRRLDKAVEALDKKFENLDLSDIERDVEASLENVSATIARQQLSIEKMQAAIEKSLKKLDREKNDKEIGSARQQLLENSDYMKIKEEIDRAMSSVEKELNSQAFRQSLQDIQTIDMDSIRKVLEKNKLDMKSELKKIREEILRAKEGIGSEGHSDD